MKLAKICLGLHTYRDVQNRRGILLIFEPERHATGILGRKYNRRPWRSTFDLPGFRLGLLQPSRLQVT